MKTFIEFWNKIKFRVVLAGFLLLLLYLAYNLICRLIFGLNPRISNPNFSTITNFDSIECTALMAGGSSINDDDFAKDTEAFANKTNNNDKFINKWVVVRGEKIYLGSYTATRDGDYLNFDEVLDLVNQKDENLLLGSGVNVDGFNLMTIILNKTKGTLSISFNSSYGGDKSVGGYNEVYVCKEVPLSTLNGSHGLPE
jgi:hypothetical protein